MESVMNFLADNYIWFFVAAGVLLFALIGFIIDSKRKKKTEFKGESIKEDIPAQVDGDTVNVGGEAVLGDNLESAPINDTLVAAEPEALNVNEPKEETVEFNDIPFNEATLNQNIQNEPETLDAEPALVGEDLNLKEVPEAPVETLNNVENLNNQSAPEEPVEFEELDLDDKNF